MNEEEIRVVLLDLGGVLMRLHDPLDTFGIELQDDEFLEKWLLSTAVRKLERGEIAAELFATEIIDEFELSYAPKEFLLRFNRWPDAFFNGIPDLLKAIAKNYHVALLSNTNAIHWERDDIAGTLEPLVDTLFLSYRTGLVKPESAAFHHVVDTLDVTAGQVLFLDDNVLNINAATRCGMRAQLTRGFDSLVANLNRAGVKT